MVEFSKMHFNAVTIKNKYVFVHFIEEYLQKFPEFYSIFSPIRPCTGIPRVGIWDTVPSPSDSVPFKGAGTDLTPSIYGVTKTRELETNRAGGTYIMYLHINHSHI